MLCCHHYGGLSPYADMSNLLEQSNEKVSTANEVPPPVEFPIGPQATAALSGVVFKPKNWSKASEQCTSVGRGASNAAGATPGSAA